MSISAHNTEEIGQQLGDRKITLPIQKYVVNEYFMWLIFSSPGLLHPEHSNRANVMALSSL